MLKRKYDHAVAIDMLKAHRRDESLDRRIDLAAGLFVPRIERALQMARVMGHHEIRAERETVGLGAEFLLKNSRRYTLQLVEWPATHLQKADL